MVATPGRDCNDGLAGNVAVTGHLEWFRRDTGYGITVYKRIAGIK